MDGMGGVREREESKKIPRVFVFYFFFYIVVNLFVVCSNWGKKYYSK